MTLYRKLGIAIILLWTLVVTILRAVRFPNDFAEAHWLLDYRFGFVRRGLVGTVFTLLRIVMHMQPTEQLIAILSGVAFAVYGLMLVALGLRIIHRLEWSTGAVLVVQVFFSSPFIVMSAHLMGYFDNLIILLTAMSIILLLKGRIWFAACLQVIAILVHENSLLVGFPVFCLAWLLLNCQRRKSGSVQLPFWPLLLPIAAFLLLVISSTLLSPDFEQSLSIYLSNFQFIRRNRSTLVPAWLSTTFFEYYSSQKESFIDRLFSLTSYNLVGPPILAILCFTFYAYRIRIASAESIILLVVCLAPQMMHVLAWDTTRILTYSILCTFLILWIYTETSSSRRNVSSAVKCLCLAVLVWNIIQLTPLMDGKGDHFTLETRLLLYTPMLVSSLSLTLCKDPVPTSERSAIQG